MATKRSGLDKQVKECCSAPFVAPKFLERRSALPLTICWSCGAALLSQEQLQVCPINPKSCTYQYIFSSRNRYEQLPAPLAETEEDAILACTGETQEAADEVSAKNQVHYSIQLRAK